MKIKIKSIVRLLSFVLLICFSLSVVYFSAINTAYSGTASKKIIINKGDTLWAIANHYYPEENPSKKTFEIAEINHLNDGSIYPGQTLVLP